MYKTMRKTVFVVTLTVILITAVFFSMQVFTENKASADVEEIFVASYGSNGNQGTELSPYKTLAYALSVCSASCKITVLDDLTLTSAVTFDGAKQVTLCSPEDDKSTVFRGFADGSLFVVKNSFSLTLEDIIIDGKKDDYTFNTNGGLINVDATSTLNILNGAVLQNSKWSGDTNGFGAGIYSAGNVNMSGGEISGNEAKIGGGIYLLTETFSMTGGEIKNNQATRYGAGVAVGRNSKGDKAGTFVMTGGKIVSNTSLEDGAGVRILSGLPQMVIGGSAEVKNNSPKNIHYTDVSQFSLGSNFSGEAGICCTAVATNEDMKIGSASGTYTGAENMFSDDNSSFFVRNVLIDEVNTLVWHCHNYSPSTVRESTCSLAGIKRYTCSLCGKTYDEEIAKLSHSIVNHSAKSPTCTEVGYYAYETCSDCDYSTYQEIAVLGHDIVPHVGQSATCTEAGYKAYDTCSRCTYTTYEEINALGHDIVPHVGKNATCIEAGYKAYDTCSRCTYTTYEELNALAHDIVPHVGQNATCIEAGYKAYDTCSRCTYTTYEEINALGHDIVPHVGQNATCIEAGYKAYDTCSRCTYTTYEEINALGHDIVPHVGQNATCTEAGYKAYDTCSRCTYTTYEEINALGHDIVPHVGQNATCTEAGYKAYDTCSRCTYTTYEELNALGHDIVPHAGQNATCTEVGYKAYDTCSRCTYTTYEEINALGHDIVPHVGKNATCIEAGYKAYDTCSRCTYTTYEELNSLGHDIVPHVGQNATCTEAGYKAYDTCSRCTYTTYEELNALGHDIVPHVGQNATCTEVGYKAYDTCSRCTYTTYEEINALGHVFGVWTIVTPSTYNEKGKAQRECLICESEDGRIEEYILPEISDTSFWSYSVVSEPNCTVKGVGKYNNETFGSLFVAIETTPHNYDENGLCVCGERSDERTQFDQEKQKYLAEILNKHIQDESQTRKMFIDEEYNYVERLAYFVSASPMNWAERKETFFDALNALDEKEQLYNKVAESENELDLLADGTEEVTKLINEKKVEIKTVQENEVLSLDSKTESIQRIVDEGKQLISEEKKGTLFFKKLPTNLDKLNETKYPTILALEEEWNDLDAPVQTIVNNKIVTTTFEKALEESKKLASTVTVKFEINENQSYISTFDKRTEKVTVPLPETRKGYTFDGWYYLGEKYDFSKEIFGSIELKAIYKLKQYKLTFIYKNGLSDKEITCGYGSTIRLENVETSEGNMFSGWKTEEDFLLPGTEYKITKDETFVACYEPVGSVIIQVVNESGEAVIDAEIIVARGEEKYFGTKTDGKLKVDSLKYGTYNIKATKEDYSITKSVVVCELNLPVTLILPETKVNVSVSGDICAFSDDLGGILESDSDEKVDIVLNIVRTTETAEGVAVKNDMQSLASDAEPSKQKTLVQFIDITFTKKEEDAVTGSEVKTTAKYINLSFEIDDELMSEAEKVGGSESFIIVYRRHVYENGEVAIDQLKKVSKEIGKEAEFECYYLQEVSGIKMITLHVKNFSTFAFGVQNEEVEEYIPETKEEEVSGEMSLWKWVIILAVIGFVELLILIVVRVKKNRAYAIAFLPAGFVFVPYWGMSACIVLAIVDICLLIGIIQAVNE